MKSYEAIQRCVNRKTEEHAKRLILTRSTVNKWQEPAEDYSDSGSLNPLDRVERLVETALILGETAEDAYAPLRYLDERFGRICIDAVPSSPVPGAPPAELLRSIKEFGDLAAAASEALADNRISKREAQAVIKEWHELLRASAAFIEALKGAAK